MRLGFLFLADKENLIVDFSHMFDQIWVLSSEFVAFSCLSNLLIWLKANPFLLIQLSLA
jgi:hypothetical protein